MSCVEEAGNFIDRGAYCDVYESLINEGEVIKCFKAIETETYRVEQSYVKEGAIYSIFKGNEHFVKVLDYNVDYDGSHSLTMEKYDCNLKKYFRLPSSRCDKDYPFIKKILYGVMTNLYFLSLYGITHRDIKSENILLKKSSKTPILCDFGIGTINHTNPTIVKKHTVQTQPFRSPEMIYFGSNTNDSKADVWSIGVLATNMIENLKTYINYDDKLYERIFAETYVTPDIAKDWIDLDRVLTRENIPIKFESCFYHSRQLSNILKRPPLLPRKELELDVSPEYIELVEFIRKLLIVNPSKRPSVFDLINDNYFKTLPEFVEQDTNPNFIEIYKSLELPTSIITYSDEMYLKIINMRKMIFIDMFQYCDSIIPQTIFLTFILTDNYIENIPEFQLMEFYDYFMISHSCLAIASSLYDHYPISTLKFYNSYKKHIMKKHIHKIKRRDIFFDDLFGMQRQILDFYKLKVFIPDEWTFLKLNFDKMNLTKSEFLEMQTILVNKILKSPKCRNIKPSDRVAKVIASYLAKK